ncbi:hypothetical protein COLO4_34162 [Corchorus olitorius]|uniref:Uncharacterized protein n=1 Tax=Corchorus olitorius TaxID=93759 RepID=A0A1R3GN56_9ROSI|nr:hypothetical protein COLO4_34162 [Corchorus olitorius]
MACKYFIFHSRTTEAHHWREWRQQWRSEGES